MVTPTPGYDPRVYEIYTRVMRQVPLATYKDDNDFGTWFRKVIGLVSKVATPLSAALGVPQVGAVVSTITSAVERKLAAKEQRRHQQNARPTAASGNRAENTLVRSMQARGGAGMRGVK